MKKKLIFGDFHGNWFGLQNILDQINYDPNEWSLIFVGDYIDGFVDKHFDVKKLIDLILDLQKENEAIYSILGNHDKWAREWIENGVFPPSDIWYYQGGCETLKCYGITKKLAYNDCKDSIPDNHIKFFNELLPSYIDDHIVVVHGGFAFVHEDSACDDMLLLKNGIITENILWDREFYNTTDDILLNQYKKVFGDRIFICGHTPWGPIVNKDYGVHRILIDGGSKGGGKLHAVVIEEDGIMGQIYNEKEI